MFCRFVFVLCCGGGCGRRRMGGDGRHSCCLELPEFCMRGLTSKCWAHKPFAIYISGSGLWVKQESSCLMVAAFATRRTSVWLMRDTSKHGARPKVPFFTQSLLLPLSLTRTPHQSLIIFREGLSGVTRLGRRRCRVWCGKRSLKPRSTGAFQLTFDLFLLPFINLCGKTIYVWNAPPPGTLQALLFPSFYTFIMCCWWWGCQAEGSPQSC